MKPSDLGLSFSEYRPHQISSACTLAGGQRFELLSAPAGSGKSLVAMTAAKLLPPNSRTLILTHNKGLQAQYLSDFPLADIRGQGNYRCPRFGDCETGKLGECELRGQYGCEYGNARDTARRSNIVLSNYAYWISVGHQDQPLGKFDMIVLDEGHNAPDILADFCSVELAHKDLRQLDIQHPEWCDDVESLSVWAEDTAYTAAETYHALKDSRSAIWRVKSERLIEALSRAANIRDYDNWILQNLDNQILLSPIWAHHYSESKLFRGIDRVAIMSATLTHETAKYLGVRDYNFTELPSSFPASNRPVYWLTSPVGEPQVRVSHRMSDEDKRRWVERIDSFIDLRLDRSGIIHTVSYARMHEIYNLSRHSNRMLIHNSYTTREMVNRFKQSTEPLILVSPAIQEGFDFSDCDARYNIIAKLPFVDTRDPVTKARVTQDKQYGNMITGQKILQTAGRTTRSESDWSETAICDDHWSWFRGKFKFPMWFRRSWITANRVPPALVR